MRKWRWIIVHIDGDGSCASMGDGEVLPIIETQETQSVGLFIRRAFIATLLFFFFDIDSSHIDMQEYQSVGLFIRKAFILTLLFARIRIRVAP